MAQLNITFNQEEILRLLGDSSGDAFKELLRESLNAVMRAESRDQIQAERYERTEGRTDMRNGTRERALTTRIGKIELSVPRHREVPFKTLVFDNYERSEAALVTTMAEMVVGGVSTAKVGKIIEALCGVAPSRSSVSEACKELDAVVGEFLGRPIEGRYPFVMADATYVKVREDRKVVSKALMVAIGFTEEGLKEVLGFGLYPAETTESWVDFLGGLKARGLRGIHMFTSDAHDGIAAALQEVFPDVPWQRCQAHFTRNISDAAPKKMRIGLRMELAEMFNCPDLDAARARRDEIISDYSDCAPDAMERLDAGFDDAMTVMEVPEQMRRCVRTTNYLERLNREIKRRTKVIGVFPNAASVMRLAGAFIVEEDERWSNAKKLYYKPAVEELERRLPELIKIARLQKELRKAA